MAKGDVHITISTEGEKTEARGDFGSATVRGMVDAIAGESGRMHAKADAEKPAREMSLSDINKELAAGGNRSFNFPGGKVRFEALQTAKAEKEARGDSDKDDPRAAALANPTPNIAVAKAIEKVAADVSTGGDQVVAAPPTAPTLETTRAAGIMFVTADGQTLFLKRAESADHSGEWCFPGGVVEGDENAEMAARREANEEVGWAEDDAIEGWTRTNAPGGAGVVNFTTFLCRIKAPFTPKLNDEHVGYAWAPVGSPPEPLHPGCRIALAKLGMDELAIARALASGDLESPQKYRNMWLFDLRITGTGFAFRGKHDEFVFRRPENYLTQDYLDRCNGLPVIMMHPAKVELDSKEFTDRVVGAMMLPYLKNNEVWGVARIYDDEAAAMMRRKQLSTSPGVILRKADGAKMTMEDGKTLLIEGKPVLMDHLAICENGVWDKGEGPTGVRSDAITENEELAMADEDKKSEDKKEEKKGDESGGGTQLDKVLAKMDEMCGKVDAVSGRMDAFEKKGDAAKADADEEKGKAEKAAADKKADAKGDADDKDDEKEEKKDDADKSDDKDDKKADAQMITISKADLDKITKRIDDMGRSIPRSMNDDDYHKLADIQARADSVYVALGIGRAPRPMDGELIPGYRRRLAKELKAHSPNLKDIGLEAIGDDAAFGILETQVYADAMHAARNPTTVAEGQLRSVPKTDLTGRTITEFVGQPRAWMSQFSAQPRRVSRINNGSPRA